MGKDVRGRGRGRGLAVALAIVGVVALASPVSPATAVEVSADQVNVLVNVSGSMGESDGSGSTKLATAREAMRQADEAAPGDAQLGLRTFGGGCTETHSVVPIDRADRTPRGWPLGSPRRSDGTPMGFALREAVKDFDTSGRRTIVLVSDGRETCGNDPVKAAHDLAGRDHSLCVDVIGVRVGDPARQQLAEIAQAACGRYYDAPDGASLLARLDRVVQRGLRPYRSSDTPIAGSSDGASPPVLEPGSYVDVMPPDTRQNKPSRWYSVDLPKGATGYFAATVSVTRPPSANTTPRLGATLYSGERQCDSATGYRLFDGGSTQVTVSLTYPIRAESGTGCGAPGRYRLKVDNSLDDARTSGVPMELLAVIEPGIGNRNRLPAADKAPRSPAMPKVNDDAMSIVGSGSYSDAPIIESGRYSDSLHSGERVMYRVKLDFGQRLAASLKLSRLSNRQEQRLGAGTIVELGLESPMRVGVGQGAAPQSEFYDGDPLAIDNSTVHVRYANRDSADPQVKASCLAGYYYLVLYLRPNAGDPYFGLSVDLSVAVQGDVTGSPAYRTTASLSRPDRQLPVSIPSPVNVLRHGPGIGLDPRALLGTFAGSVMLVAGAVGVGVFRRLLRSGPP